MKILVVDDHVLIRQAVHSVLKKLRRDAIILEAPTCEQAMQIVAKNSDIKLILLDLTLPDRDGFSALTELRDKYPAISVVVLSAAQDPERVMRALDLGALGFIPKSAERDVMLGALRLVFSGGIYIPPQILAHADLMPETKQQDKKNQSSLADIGLTERQLNVLSLVMEGKSNKTICRTLNLAEPTVKNHVTAILRALKVSNRTEAVIAVNQLGWKFPQITKQ